MEEVRKKEFGDSKTLAKEQKAIADAMRLMQKKGVHFETAFEAHGLKRDGKKRKRTMVKLLFTNYEWVDASSNVVMKILKDSNDPMLQSSCYARSNSTCGSNERFGEFRCVGSVSCACPHG